MRTTLAIAKKELAIYLTTPWAWIVFTFMAFASSFFFILSVTEFQRVQEYAKVQGWEALGPNAAPYRNLTDGVIISVWGAVIVLILFVAPFLSMRLFAEERRQKTFELLMTTPVRSSEIVLGKYLGGLGIIFCTLLVTMVYPIVVALFGASESGHALEWSTVWLGFFGLLLWAATCMALGTFVSSLTESQMLAAVVSFVVALVWFIFDGLAANAAEPLRSVLQYLSFGQQLQNLLKGVLDLKPIVFFSSLIAFFLMMTHRSVESQRWS